MNEPRQPRITSPFDVEPLDPSRWPRYVWQDGDVESEGDTRAAKDWQFVQAPSHALRAIAEHWGIEPETVTVLKCAIHIPENDLYIEYVLPSGDGKAIWAGKPTVEDLG